MNSSKTSDYKSSGVDVEAGDQLVEWLQESDTSSVNPKSANVIDGIGGFASLFRFPIDKYKKPCLITCTDGVGTKVKLAAQFERMESVGQDLVAMCVNDLICTGGDPLLFLDYYAVGKLDLKTAKVFLQGVRKACADSDCLLVGGETAEMPGVYMPPDFDCAGFAVGVVEEDDRWGSHRVQAGDQLLAIESSGFHSNGFSLLRKLFAEDAKNYLHWLLEPTRLYVKPVQKLKKKIPVQAAAHITGGGVDNIPRVIPTGLSAKIQVWDFPESFQWVQKKSGLSKLQLLKTLNCGVGFVLILKPEHTATALQELKTQGLRSWLCGEIVAEKTAEGLIIEGAG